MPGAVIRFDQAANPIPIGTPGVARDDIWLSQPVVSRSTLSGNTAWQWSFLDVPPGSAAVFSGSTTAAATFTPDIPGTYRIQLVTNGGGLGNIVVLVVRVRYSSTGALLYHGLCLPAFGERVNEDNVLIPPVSGPQNLRGYAPFFESILAYVLTLSGGGGGVTPATVINATGNLALPSVDTVYLVESTASITQTFTGTPLDGLELTFIDGTKNWDGFNFFINGQSSSTLLYPENPGEAASPSVYCTLRGGAFTLKWSTAENQWGVKSVAFGYTPPYNVAPWGSFTYDISDMTLSGPSYEMPIGEFAVGNTNVVITDTGSLLTGAFQLQVGLSPDTGFLFILTNQTAYAMTVVNYYGGPTTTIPGSSGPYYNQEIVFSDSVNGVVGLSGGGGGGWSVSTQDVSAGGSVGVSLPAGTNQLVLTGTPGTPVSLTVTSADPGDAYEILVTSQVSTQQPVTVLDATAQGQVFVAPLASAAVVCDGYTILQGVLSTPAQRVSYPGESITTYTPTNPTFNAYWVDTTGVGGAQFVLPPVASVCDHYRLTIKDNTGSFGGNNLQVVALDGAAPRIENLSLGSYGLGTGGVALATSGMTITFEYGADENIWFIVSP